MDTVDFDPGSGTTNIISQGLADIFILKLDTNGSFIWVKTIGGSPRAKAYSISTDKFGNVYTTGLFLGTVDFDPGNGTFVLGGQGVEDIFGLKLDPWGNFNWAIALNGFDYNKGIEIVTDQILNVYIIGVFGNTADFDPGSGVVNLSSNGSSDIFVLKLIQSGVGVRSPLSSELLKVYPNPTKGNLNIELNRTFENLNVKVLNLYGQEVLDQDYKSTNEISFNLNLPSGLYFVELNTPDGKYAILKVVKE